MAKGGGGSKDGFSFRGALLQVCTSGMGRETWKKFCCLFDVPESVTEKGRSSLLGYLVDSGLVSSEKPECLAEQLRSHLERHDLAQKFLGKHMIVCILKIFITNFVVHNRVV